MKLHTLTWGELTVARTAVLIHGVTSNAQSWARVGPALAARGYCVFAPDLRGHGESAKAGGQYALAQMVADLPESVPSAPHLLVGHSFGGVMAILGVQSGALAPASLALEDPVLHFADRDTPARLLRNDEANLPRDVEGTLRLNPRWTRLDAEGKVASLAAIDWSDMHEVFAANAPWDLRPALLEVARRVPTRLIVPPNSFYVPDADVAALRAALGEQAIVQVPGTGHSVHRDDLNAFLAALQEFSDRVR